MAGRQVYLEELAKLRNDVIRMGSIVEAAMSEVIHALSTLERAKAEKIMEGDDRIDEMEVQIEEQCIHLIASQQPVATDLRQITSVMRIISDIERIADHCSDTSEYIIRLEGERIPLPEHVEDMVDLVRDMLHSTVDAYVREDASEAQRVIASDDQVDDYFESITHEIYVAMKHNPEKIPSYGEYLMIIKYLERMGDHCTNIAGWIRFIVTGQLEM